MTPAPRSDFDVAAAVLYALPWGGLLFGATGWLDDS